MQPEKKRANGKYNQKPKKQKTKQNKTFPFSCNKKNLNHI